MGIEEKDGGTVETNSDGIYESVNALYGMIDNGAYCCSSVTWPMPMARVAQTGELTYLSEVPDSGDAYYQFVKMNVDMFSALNGVNSADIYQSPSLIIASTMDMEYAYIEGYEGKVKPQNELGPFVTWIKQLSDMEEAVLLNPLRLFPLYSYDPRRHRLPETSEASEGTGGWREWDEPFSRIVGSDKSDSEVKKIWLGFCMNPALGFRPFDEFCEHLPKFYEKCEKNDIPILARCAADGFLPLNVFDYKNFRLEERDEKSVERDMCDSDDLPYLSCEYCGEGRIHEYPAVDYFYRNYGHPKNWVPVLECYPDLRLCLSNFGGNRVWQYLNPQEWADDDEMPGKDWILCIMQLTRYKNVYVDISGLDIVGNVAVRIALINMLEMIFDEDEEFKHLRYKLIFGSGWYLDNKTDYTAYCKEFREIVDFVDNTGDLWDRISLVNPWNFYNLSGDKIEQICNELAKNIDESTDHNGLDELEKMKKVFYGSPEDDEVGLIDYVTAFNNEDPIPDMGDVSDDEGLVLSPLLLDDEDFRFDSQDVEMYWSNGESEMLPADAKTGHYADLNLHVKGYPGENIEVTVKRADGELLFEDKESLTLSATVQEDEDEVVFENVFGKYKLYLDKDKMPVIIAEDAHDRLCHTVSPVRPRWDDVYAGYPLESGLQGVKADMPADKVFTSVFGRYDREKFKNACAARVSIALIQSGMKLKRDFLIQPNTELARKGFESAGFITSARGLKEWLELPEVWGKPDVEISGSLTNTLETAAEEIGERNGVYIILGGKDKKDHATLWIGRQGNVVGGNHYIGNGGTVYFWELKGNVVADEDIVEVYWTYGEGRNPLRDSIKGEGGDIWESKRYEDLNFHVKVKPGNNGKTVMAQIKCNGKVFELSGNVSGDESCFEKVFEQYV